MNPEIKICQKCQAEFAIEPDDFLFYEKIRVPPPTWCPECSMIRRFVFFNERKLFRRKDDASGKEIFSGIPPQAPIKVYEHDYWWSDKWDPIDYGRDYDFSRTFLEQFRDLLYEVPWASRNIRNSVNSDYCNNADNLKNCYLCFDSGTLENSAYVIDGEELTDSFDLYSARHTELSYDNYMADEVYKIFFSVNCEECTEVWFSRNLYGCSNCFGCVNLRGKSYHIFNVPYTKEEYQNFLAEFNSGSYGALEDARSKAYDFWKKFPMRFTLAINVTNSTGEHIERSKNLKLCYSVHGAENLAYCQLVWPPITDSYDCTSSGGGVSLLYESAGSGIEGSYGLKVCWDCWPSCVNLEYSAHCHSSSDLFGCVGLKKKQYCILNKQYSKDDYKKLVARITKHMDEMPYVDKQGRVYKYGEFFPPEFSPFAYNETIAQDFFTLSEAEAKSKGFLWREPERREYEITIKAQDLPDHIKDVDDSILKEIIGCSSCGRAYRIIPMELEFYRKIPLPLPRLCPECRFQERFKFVNPPKWRHAACQCAGKTSDPRLTTHDHYQYQNTAEHFHGDAHCPNEFKTSYSPERPEIVYCEQCYQSEIL